jgi:GT2 family glycosyltransferase
MVNNRPIAEPGPVIDLSVIMPMYNAEEFVGVQMEALAAQRWSRTWELVVSDNGSSDRSVSICHEYQSRIENLQMVDASEHRGAAYARNAAARQARGASIAFCDADDVVTPGWVRAMGEALDEHQWVVGRIDSRSLNPPWLWSTRPALPAAIENFEKRFAVVPSGNSGIRRSLFEAVGGFDATIPPGITCEDDDFSVRVHLLGERPHFAADAVIYYRFRTQMREVFRQARGYGRGDTFMADRYPHLDYWRPERSRIGVMFLRALRESRTKSALAKWLWEIGQAMGQQGY